MFESKEPLVESIASALKASSIPCVLWGHCLLNVHGVPSIIGSIDFVVPDQLISVAADVISELPNLEQCPSVELCFASSPERRTPPPTFHVHIKASEVTVGLYTQAETLWFLPLMNDSILSGENASLSPTFALACDRDVLPPWRPGRGTGAFQSSNSSVVVPRAHILLESYLRLYARDAGKTLGSFAMAMIAYMEEYVDDGLLDSSQLPEPLQTFYKELRVGEKPVRQWTKEFRQSLNISDEESDDEYL
ncbi:hypothetical protein CSIM01_08259 [Colletotrichum simmondsii]|uniref:Thioredoxin reductase n=1 Tax=Colletotrichum simmondsii TaxID=703756 RepID=A0A135TTI1_9PEZI|nr:hypothetical protein CSIM01_08259 [Colletotrichum simmondsii]